MPETVAMPQDHSLLQMVLGSSPVVQGVLFILIILSIMSWAIAIAKMLQYKKAHSDSEEFTSLFWETRNFSRVDDSTRRLHASPLARIFSAGFKEISRAAIAKDAPGVKDPVVGRSALDIENIERMLRHAEQEESVKLERGLTFLATVASAAPFIGLFGTVWGIMNAFHGLGAPGAASTLQAVAPGISEALVATAIGLAAAIPAAVAYNYFAVGLKHFRESMECFISDFLALSKGA